MKKKILIIDDEPDVTKYLRSMLEKEDFEALVAQNGQEGYEMLSNVKIDAIVTDFAMSPIDGYEFCRMVKEQEKFQDIPILVCTAHPSSEGTFRKIGIDDYLVKPFTPDDLVSSLNRVFKQLSHKIKFKKILVQSDDMSVPEKVAKQMEQYGYRVDFTTIPENDNIIEKSLIIQPDIVIFNALQERCAPAKLIKTLISYPDLKNVQIIFYADHTKTVDRSRKAQSTFGEIKKSCLEAGAAFFMGPLNYENLLDVVMNRLGEEAHA